MATSIRLAPETEQRLDFWRQAPGVPRRTICAKSSIMA